MYIDLNKILLNSELIKKFHTLNILYIFFLNYVMDYKLKF